MKKLHALTRAIAGFAAAIATTLPAHALPPSVQAVVMNTGQVRKIDPYWPSSTPDSGCWTVQVENPHVLAPATRPETIRLFRPGFNANGDATTYVDELVRTVRVRQIVPHGIPTGNGVTGAQGAFSDRDALSDYVYKGDRAPGLINGCLTESPKPIANWRMMHRTVVKNTLAGEITAWHRNGQQGRMVASIKLRVADSDGGGDCATATVNSTAVSGRATDKAAVTIYPFSLDITGCAQGILTLNSKVYPWRGGAASVLDSAVDGTAGSGRDFGPRYFLKDDTLFDNPPIVVLAAAADAGDGVGTPTASCAISTTLATAKATPCGTPQQVLDRVQTLLGATTGADGVIVYTDDGTHDIDSATNNVAQKVACITFRRLPTSTSRAAVIIASGDDVASPRLGTSGSSLTSPITTGCLRFEDVTLQRNGVQAFVTGGASQKLELQIVDSTFDQNGQTLSWVGTSGQTFPYLDGVTFTTVGNNYLAPNQNEFRMLSGIDVDFNGSGGIENWLVVGSLIKRPPSNGVDTFSSRNASGTIFAFNRIQCPSSTTVWRFQGGDVNGFVNFQNVYEWCTTTAGHSFAVSNDSAAYSTFHGITGQNTFVGYDNRGRENRFYDEGATRRTQAMQLCVGDLHVSVYHKGDWFRYVNEADTTGGAFRTGNWGYLHGVGCRGEFSQYRAVTALGGNEAQIFPGMDTTIGVTWNNASQTVKLDPLFVDYQGVVNGTTAGAGGGDYDVQSGSPVTGIVKSGVISHDFEGVARPATNDSAGAYVPGAMSANDNAPNLVLAA